MIVSAMICLSLVRKFLIDRGSSVSIIFKKVYDQRRMEAKDLILSKACILGFNSAATEAVGYVELPVELRDGDCTRVRILPFVVLDVDSQCNVFLDRSTIVGFRVAIAN